MLCILYFNCATYQKGCHLQSEPVCCTVGHATDTLCKNLSKSVNAKAVDYSRLAVLGISRNAI